MTTRETKVNQNITKIFELLKLRTWGDGKKEFRISINWLSHTKSLGKGNTEIH